MLRSAVLRCAALRCAALRCVALQPCLLLSKYLRYSCPAEVECMTNQYDVCAGDAVVLQRWTDDRFKLHMHIIKDASDSIVASAVPNTTKGKAKRGTAGMTQRRTKTKSPPNLVPSCRQDARPYGPGSLSLEALHDAALLCADTPFPHPSTSTHRQFVAPSNECTDTAGRSVVPAAVVAAADAAAVQQQGSRAAVATDLAQNADRDQESVRYHDDAVCLSTAAQNDAVYGT